jgi:hypothetical protein
VQIKRRKKQSAGFVCRALMRYPFIGMFPYRKTIK